MEEDLSLSDTEGNNYELIPNDPFDTIIGFIEDMLVCENFHVIMKNFLEKYWKQFDYSEENKLIYMDIFSEYTTMVEEYISNYLASRIPDFSMKILLNVIERNKNNLDGEIFEILFTMSDFLKFKETMLDFRKVKEGLVAPLDLNAGIKCLQDNGNNSL